MISINAIIKNINGGVYDSLFKKLYTKKFLNHQKNRYLKTISDFISYHDIDGEELAFIVSAPGRTEIGGNHTDHQNGCVLGASINMDAIAVVTLTNNNIITLKSENYDENIVNLNNLEVVDGEKNSSNALIKGVAAGIKNNGGNIGGFKAFTTSSVLKGSGLSSSAAFEVLTGNILNHGYNKGLISPIDIAKIGQYAENVYFLKPSGLLDQATSSIGNFVFMDFKDESPIVKEITYDLKESGHTLCIVDTGGNHADLTDDYAAIPQEMKAIANHFNKKVLREVDTKDFYNSIKTLKQKYGDRAVLRAIHFFNENKRVIEEVKALENNDFSEFLNLVNKSGQSSFNYLQNVSTYTDKMHQNIPLALALTDTFLNGKGAFRVHGGGFAGTIQAYIPNNLVSDYKKMIEKVFSKNSFHMLTVRPVGGTRIA